MTSKKSKFCQAKERLLTFFILTIGFASIAAPHQIVSHIMYTGNGHRENNPCLSKT